MSVLMVVLRVFHIVGAIIWVGSSFMMVFYIEPMLQAMGVEGRPFATRLLGSSTFSKVMALAAVATVFSGLGMYWKDSQGLSVDWLRTGQGIMFTIGGIAGILASAMGMTLIGPINNKLSQAQRELSADNPQLQTITRVEVLQTRLVFATRLDFCFMIVAVIAMATARYFTFVV